MTNCKCGCDVKEWCKHIIWVDCGGGYWLYKETLKNQFGVSHDIRPNEHWDFCPVSDCGKARPKRHECKKKSLAEKFAYISQDGELKWSQVYEEQAKAAVEHHIEILRDCWNKGYSLEQTEAKFREES